MRIDKVSTWIGEEAYCRIKIYSLRQHTITVSHLLTSEHGLRILQYLGDYLASDTLTVTYKGERITEDIIVSNSGTENNYSISPREYDAVIPTQIQQEITLLKHTKDK